MSFVPGFLVPCLERSQNFLASQPEFRNFLVRIFKKKFLKGLKHLGKQFLFDPCFDSHDMLFWKRTGGKDLLLDHSKKCKSFWSFSQTIREKLDILPILKEQIARS